MSQIPDKVGYYVMEIKGQDDIMDTCEYPKGNRKIVVFDYLVSALDKIQSKIACHFKDGKHHDFPPIYLIQSYSDVPQKLRLNCSHVILYPPVTKNHCNLIVKENVIDPKLFDHSIGPVAHVSLIFYLC